MAASTDKTDMENFNKIKELSMIYVRMAVQNIEFSVYSNHRLVFSAIHAACTVLMLDKRYGQCASPSKVNSARGTKPPIKSNYFKNFRSQFWQVIAQLEQRDGSPLSFSE